MSQLRGGLWLTLLEQNCKQNPALIAKSAGIGNPKRIYVIRKQLSRIRPERIEYVAGIDLEIEAEANFKKNQQKAFLE